MSEPILKILESEVVELPKSDEEERFQRFSLMGWWDQTRIREAKVLVIGAGALGNEIIKNLCLLGFGHLFIADLDRIENSNLSRSVLYRAADNGKSKSETAVRSARDLFPGVHADSFDGNIIYDLGLGVYHWADMVIAGLDNREARLSINRSCWKVNKPWIDGAIEQISGVARVFVPDGVCYECTMSETDWQLLNRRRSCNLLTRDEMQEGKVPTTPTISSIIAGVQCQEAVKLIHGMETIASKGFVFNGVTADSYLVEYQRNEDCYSHDIAECVTTMPWRVSEVTVGEVLSYVRGALGEDVVLELGRDILTSLKCPGCDVEEERYMSLGKAGQSLAVCPHCGTRREVRTAFTIHGDESFMDKTFAEIGVPAFDIVWARSSEHFCGYVFGGDAAQVLREAR